MEKRKTDDVPSRWTWLPYVLIAVVILFVVIAVLALLGPTQGNIFSNITLGLNRSTTR